jgi:hypothetical protein
VNREACRRQQLIAATVRLVAGQNLADAFKRYRNNFPQRCFSDHVALTERRCALVRCPDIQWPISLQWASSCDDFPVRATGSKKSVFNRRQDWLGL